MKDITLIRHAKSSWKASGLADFDRPLNRRGKRDAPMMGRRLAAIRFEPDLILASPAKRARKTAQWIAAEIGYEESGIQFDETVYAASVHDLLVLMRKQDDRHAHVAVVGHNPSITDFSHFLTGQPIANVPTCGVVRVSLPIASWRQIQRACGELMAFDFPKRR